jgi:hypothetical protein
MQRMYRTSKGTELPLLNLRGREYLEVKYRLVWFREDHPDWAIETELLSVTDDSAYARATIKDEKSRIIATSHKFESKKGFPDFIEKAETGAIGRALALIGYGTQFCADELDEGDRIVDAPVDQAAPRTASAPAPASPHRTSASQTFDGSLAGDDARELGRRQPKKASGPNTATSPVTAASGPSAKAAAPSGESASGENRVSSPSQEPGDYRIEFGKKYKGLKLKDIPIPELEGYLEWLEENAAKKGLPLSEEARFLKVAVGRYLQLALASAGKGAKTETSKATAQH